MAVNVDLQRYTDLCEEYFVAQYSKKVQLLRAQGTVQLSKGPGRRFFSTDPSINDRILLYVLNDTSLHISCVIRNWFGKVTNERSAWSTTSLIWEAFGVHSESFVQLFKSRNEFASTSSTGMELERLMDDFDFVYNNYEPLPAQNWTFQSFSDYLQKAATESQSRQEKNTSAYMW
ncbi:MAG: hypothetical protein Q9191_007961 [Dirinaria sp. TL-2023a]